MDTAGRHPGIQRRMAGSELTKFQNWKERRTELRKNGAAKDSEEKLVTEKEFRVINEKIGCWEASENPLSADVGVIRSGGRLWLYDVGDGEENVPEQIEDANIILPHFHRDHAGNIDRVCAGTVYVSKETRRHIRRGTVVEREGTSGELKIFPLPSSHARGCLGLEADGQYAFVGDALYGRMKDGQFVYNVQFLKEEIAELEEIYGSRSSSSPEIVIRQNE